MGSLREEIWDVVLPEVQEFRLDAASDGGSISDACHELASASIRTREAAALNAEGRMLDRGGSRLDVGPALGAAGGGSDGAVPAPF